jgi:putative endonuclease
LTPAGSRLELGARGEAAAAEWYIASGGVLLARNWRCREGELDLVVSIGRLIVFCEVKTRTTAAFGIPAEAVTYKKQRRLRRLAARWLEEHRGGVGFSEVRFDVACVTVAAGGGLVVEIVEAAF